MGTTIGTYIPSTGEAFDSRGVSLGRFSDHDAAVEAMHAAKLPANFWNSESLPPVPLLQQLNDWVIRQNEKRLPKWKFRFAPDFAIQIQSRLTRQYALLFEGQALHTENVTARLFTEPKQLHSADRRYWRVNFKLFAHEGSETWIFKPKLGGCSRTCSYQGTVGLRARIIEALRPDHFVSLNPSLMLSPNCLCCGRGLTDPASMARWIGPECWGSGSTNVPRVFKETAA